MSIRVLSSLRAKLTSGLLPVVYLLTVLVIVTAGFFASHVHRTAETITLPILVYPPDGTSAHVESVVLTVDDPSGVNRLYVQAHQPFYHRGGTMLHGGPGFDPETAAEIRINGGTWIPVDDEHVACAQPEARHGCVAGAFSTIRFSVPAANVHEGENLVEFRFNGSKGIRSGYRVLTLGFMRSGHDLNTFDPFIEGAHDPGMLAREDPSTWTVPSGSNPANGERLWHEASLVENVLTGEPIRASCASCHVSDGSDLKYFSYSNRVIEARSRFHGLSEEQARDIAAYIRSVELRTEEGRTYEAPGRPWTPPYQPGPTALASREPGEARTAGASFVETGAWSWAAGAGLDWVTDDPSVGLDYVFAQNPTAGGVLNMRTIPINVQFPDWNNWLPDVHPLDAFGKQFRNSEPWKIYTEEIRGAERTPSEWHDVLADLGGEARQIRHDMSGGLTQREEMFGEVSFMQWASVKTFGAQLQHHLADKAPLIWPETGEFPGGEPLAWISNGRLVFDIAPHIGTHYGRAPFVYGSRKLDAFFSHLWYHLQVILAPGQHTAPSGQNPVDWKYQFAFLKSAQPGTVRYLSSWIKMVQELMARRSPDDERTINAYTHHPARAVRPLSTPSMTKGLTEEEQARVLGAVAKVWLEAAEAAGIENFQRGTDRNRFYWENSNYVFDNNNWWWRNPGNAAEEFWAVVFVLRREGVDPMVVADMAAWGEKLWPNGNWEQFTQGASDAVVRITNLANGNTFSAPVDLVVEVDAYIFEGSIEKVEMLADGKKVGEQTDAPYRFTWQDVPIGRHTITARATDGDGNESTTTVTIKVTESTASAMQRIPLEKGWNLVSSRLLPPNPELEIMLAGLHPHLVLVKDENGASYVPAYQINTIGSWREDEAYMVYLNAADTLEIPGTPLSPTAAIPLHAGWNLVPYWPDAPLSVEEAFASISAELVKVKDAAGRMYIPGKQNEIGRLQPGKGYKVYVAEATRLVYPAGSYASVKSPSSPSAFRQR